MISKQHKMKVSTPTTVVSSWLTDNIIPQLQRNELIAPVVYHRVINEHFPIQMIVSNEILPVRLAQGNYENDLQATQNESFHSNDCGLFLTGSVSTDIRDG
jgi:hypothetical protein